MPGIVDLADAADELTVVGDADTNMTLRVIGGGDDDRFVVEGRGSGVRLYDDEDLERLAGRRLDGR